MPINILEFKCDVSKEQKEFIEHLLSADFPLYYQESTDKYTVFGHSFLYRNNKDVEGVEGIEGVINSGYWGAVYNLFSQICAKYHIEHNIIYRAALNVTTFNQNKIAEFHIDHAFPHKNFIIYLNDFSNGSTYIQDEDTKKIKEIKAEKYKVAIFDGHMHAQGFCGNGERRVVLVVTFN